jgi:hypothetical protein
MRSVINAEHAFLAIFTLRYASALRHGIARLIASAHVLLRSPSKTTLLWYRSRGFTFCRLETHKDDLRWQMLGDEFIYLSTPIYSSPAPLAYARAASSDGR